VGKLSAQCTGIPAFVGKQGAGSKHSTISLQIEIYDAIRVILDCIELKV